MSAAPFNSDRYQRQILLKGFGHEGQIRLHRLKVLVVGAGGLGCPALQYLVAAGVGTVGVVDDDTVSLHNLPRQTLYATGDVGGSKAEVAVRRLRSMNPEVNLVSYPVRLGVDNAVELISAYDVVLDATDAFASRYLINDACVLLQKPMVYGAVSQFEGQVAIFNCGGQPVNYRDLFPHPPKPGSILNCAEAGVMGVLPGIIGTMQAAEVIKLATGLGDLLCGRLYTYNALSNAGFVFDIVPSPEARQRMPQSVESLRGLDYEAYCGNHSEPVEEVDVDRFNAMIKAGFPVIDVREFGEQPHINEFAHEQVPLSELPRRMDRFPADTVVLFCQSGKRSREAAGILSAHFGPAKKVYSLRGGIINWTQHGSKKG